jgi:ATP-dependent RNA helicase DeaD
MSNTIDEASGDDNPFGQLGLDPRIVAAVQQLGFESPTPIQAAAIPPLLEGNDLLGRARTGSGKTAAFGLPVLQKLSRGGEGLRALILAPTRELAVQITTALQSYAHGLGLKMVTLYGGSAYGPQLKALRRGVDIVVGTPGRLIDHLERGSLDLSTIELVVVDEADEMLRMGFVDDVDQLLAATPEGRQVALFSATMPAPIRRVAETYLEKPLEVQVEARRMVVEHIEQHRIDVPERHKVDALVRVLKSKQPGATLIFARTRDKCDELTEALRDRGFYSQALHGNMSQPAREEVLGALRTGRLEFLVATDVAARGIDVEHLTHVINFDLPDEAEVYVNRIGRTGRAGRAGTAISLVSNRDSRLLRRIEAVVKRKIPRRAVPTDAEIVRRQREQLEKALVGAVKLTQNEGAKALTASLLEGDWTPPELAEAALGLLIQDRHLDIEASPSEKPPIWAQRSDSRRDGARWEGGGKKKTAKRRFSRWSWLDHGGEGRLSRANIRRHDRLARRGRARTRHWRQRRRWGARQRARDLESRHRSHHDLRAAHERGGFPGGARAARADHQDHLSSRHGGELFP